MSRQPITQGSPPNLPDLPLELWHEVIEFATYLPDTLQDPIMAISNSRLRTERYKVSMTTKSSVTRVCRSWREFGTPLLFEHIVISKSHQILLVLKALAGGGTHSGGTPLGQLIRRIDVRHLRWVELQDTSEAMTCILKHAPNLAILTMSRTPWYSWDPLEALFTPPTSAVMCPSLQYLCLVGSTAPIFTPQRYFSFVGSHPRLRYMDCSMIALGHPSLNLGPVFYPSIREIQFPPLSEVHAGCPPIDTPAGALPNLVSAVVPYMIGALSALEPVLSLHGSNLKSLRLVRADTLLVAFPSRHPEHLRLIRDSCPRLQELSFGVIWAAQFPNPLRDGVQVTLPKVENLAVELMASKGQFSRAECRDLLENVSSWKGRNWAPKLRTIQFISESNVVHIRRYYSKMFDAFLQKCGSSGIQVEDPFCNPLNNPPPYAPSSS